MLEQIMDLLELPAVKRFLWIILGIIIILFLVRLIKKSLGHYVKADSWYKTKKTINVFGYIMIALLLAIVYSDQLGGVTVAFGVAGAGIAFALQEVITSFAGWVAILVGGFYKIGDRVQVGGIKGDVIDLGLLRTTVMELGQWVDGDLYNGRIVRIANSFVFKEPVFNYSADFEFLWDEIRLPIKYGSNYKLVQQILEDIGREITIDYMDEARHSWAEMVRKFMIEDACIDVMVTMKANDNWVEFTLRYVVDYKQRRSVQDVMFRSILEEFANHKDEIGMASTTIEISGWGGHREDKRKN